MTDCQFFASKSSSCRRKPIARLISLERGPLWLCVEVHFAMQDRRDQEMRRKAMAKIHSELMLNEALREASVLLIDGEPLLVETVDD